MVRLRVCSRVGRLRSVWLRLLGRRLLLRRVLVGAVVWVLRRRSAGSVVLVVLGPGRARVPGSAASVVVRRLLGRVCRAAARLRSLPRSRRRGRRASSVVLV